MTDYDNPLARRFQNARPGLELLAIESAVIPVTVVRCSVLAQERKSLPIMEEFVLRFVANGVSHLDEISALMGLEVAQIREAAAIQISAYNLTRRGLDEVLLTEQGREAARDLSSAQPVLRQLPVVFDRLIWTIVDYPRGRLITKKAAQESGALVLPAARKSRISSTDVTPAGFNALLRAREGRQRQIDVLSVRDLSPNTHRYFPADLLVYGDSKRRELELGLVIDGEPATVHGDTMARMGAIERLHLSIGQAAARPQLDEELERRRADSPDVRIAASSDGEVREAVDSPDVVRGVSVFEHPILLRAALQEAKSRILIISPWVRRAVVDDAFVDALEARLRARVRVTIAYGIGRDDSGSDASAVAALGAVAQRFPKLFYFARLKNTHAKILIWDDRWVTTSFNWLSFKGDPQRTYRMEEGTLVRVPEEVDRAYVRFSELIASQRAEEGRSPGSIGS